MNGFFQNAPRNLAQGNSGVFTSINDSGDCTIGGNLYVTGQEHISGETIFHNDVTVNGNITATLNIYCETISANVAATLIDVNILQGVQVSGGANIDSLVVTGTSNLIGNVSCGNINSTANIFSSGDLIIEGASFLSGLITAQEYSGSEITLTGNLSCANLSATQANISGTANITSNIYGGDNLFIVGHGNISGNLFGNNITSNNNCNVDGNLFITGYSNLTGNLNASNILGTQANISGTSNLVGNVFCSSDLFVIGYSNLTGNLNCGNILGTQANISGTSNLVGNVSCGNINSTGTISATTLSATTFNADNLTTTGNLTVDGWANITGLTTLTSNLTCNGDILNFSGYFQNTYQANVQPFFLPMTIVNNDSSNLAQVLLRNYNETTGGSGILFSLNNGIYPDNYHKCGLFMNSNNSAPFGKGDMYMCVNQSNDNTNATLTNVMQRWNNTGTIELTGNVGINTLPSYVFDCNGEANISANLIAQSNIICWGSQANLNCVANITGNVFCGTDLFVVGYSNLTGNLNCGNILGTQANISGTSNLVGDVYCGSDFFVDGLANITGNINTSSDLYVGGTSDFIGNVSCENMNATGTQNLTTVFISSYLQTPMLSFAGSQTYNGGSAGSPTQIFSGWTSPTYSIIFLNYVTAGNFQIDVSASHGAGFLYCQFTLINSSGSTIAIIPTTTNNINGQTYPGTSMTIGSYALATLICYNSTGTVNYWMGN